MKVLQLIQRPQLRGAEIFACQLSMELIRKGSAADVVYLFDQPNALQFKLNFISLGGSSRKRFWDFQAYRRLSNIIRNGGYDIVQANAGDTLKYAALSKLMFGWKTPLIYRNANKISDFINSKSKHVLNKFFINHLQHVISVSELCKNDFIKIFKFPEEKIDVVQIGIDLETVGDLPTELAPLFSEGPVLLNVASFVKEKNHEGLLSIFSKVLTHMPDAKLVLIGKGKLEDEVKNKATRLGIRSKVHFLGSRNDVQSIMQVSQAFLLPSHIEGLPAVVLEAQLNRVPVIAYDVGGISEVVHDGKTGWLITKGDEESFVLSVTKSIRGDRAHMERIVANAHAQVLLQYDNVIIAERFYKIYQGIIRLYSTTT